jgi:catechol 2,3-dioxygenase-like lactoylglutathione lyase family enzyme
MTTRSHFEAIFPIGDTNPQDLPVRELEAAVRFYQDHMGFAVQERTASPLPSALLRRDDVTMRLAENGGDPEQASCFIRVSDVDAAIAEMQGQGLDVSPPRVDRTGNGDFRVFFVRAPDGLCYCLGREL